MDFEAYSSYIAKTQPDLLNQWESHGDKLRSGLAKLVRETARSVEV
jgi:hypothetical protein